MKEATFNLEPHWPGVLRWLANMAESLNCEVVGTAITGGDEIEMYACVRPQRQRRRVYRLDNGQWTSVAMQTWEDIRDRALCWMQDDVIKVGGKFVD